MSEQHYTSIQTTLTFLITLGEQRESDRKDRDIMAPVMPKLSDIRRSIEIAYHDNLKVIGKVNANGTMVYAVPSRSQPGVIHLPYVDTSTNRVVCDCQGYEHRGVCAHAMVATRAIIAEAQAAFDAVQKEEKQGA